MADEVELTITAEPVAETPAEETVPLWASQLRSELSETNSLLRDSLELSRNQNNLLPQVMETNANLTSQLQRVPGEIIELVKPLLIPPVSIVTPLMEEPPLVEESVLPVVDVPPESETPAVAARRKLRAI